MNLKSNLDKLEYNKIIDLLSNFCTTYIGKNLAFSLVPSFKKEKVQRLLNETFEATNLITRKGNLPIYDISDITAHLKKLESDVSLSCKELLEIANILKLSRELKDYLYKDENFDLSEFTILDNMFSNLYSNLDLEKLIFSSIIDENTIADDASKKLSSIRREKRKIENNIKDSLTNILHSSTYSKAIMDSIVTIRNDRYVIPIKEEYRSLVKGFVHDISSSGSTVFIEPIQVFELNSNLQNLKIEENLEIDHILSELSIKVSPYTKELENDVSLIGILDFIFAKANLAKKINGVLPILTDMKQINFKQARHPLINENDVVPIDIEIGNTYSSLIITGPNTGGKTVTLKTTGLLCAMAYSGLFIPANYESSLYVFDNIFVDIGDEQSIQESLSTFSSHVTNIIDITENVTANSLVLIDELGSGTDPIEGAALAISILEYFHKLNTICLVTTHYKEIKDYALVTDDFENASSSFDIENLKPTYKLLIGIPGKSNAFAISKKLGLKEEILLRAKELLKSDTVSTEELLKNIYDDKIKIEHEKNEIQKNKNQIEQLRKNLEQEKNRQLDINNNKIEQAEIKAKEILLSSKDEANEIIKELNQIYDNLKALENIDFDNMSDLEISSFVKLHFQKGSLKNANQLRNKLNTSLDKISNSNIATENTNNINFDKNDFKVGDKIKLSTFNDIATITSLSGKKNQMQVQIGNAKMTINIEDIESLVKNDNKNTYITNNKNNLSNTSFKTKNISTEINVIGQNIEDACFIIDKYLDDCYLSKISPVRIVHGKGTGKLREGIHSFLKKHPHVENFRLGTFGEGEMGVTIVELKKG